MIHSPIKNLKLEKFPTGSVTQWFGENPALYRAWGLAFHNGIDIVAPHGTPMYAVEDARVVAVKLDPKGFGKYIRLRSLKLHDGAYREWTYGHCSTIREVEGAIVKAGDHIANMGNTGFVVSGATPYWKVNPYAGTHLHLGLRYLVPDEDGWSHSGDNIKYQVEDYNNGVKGAVDPRKLFDNIPETVDIRRTQMLTIVSLLNTLIRLLSNKK